VVQGEHGAGGQREDGGAAGAEGGVGTVARVETTDLRDLVDVQLLRTTERMLNDEEASASLRSR
jgi:hypothetical protein